MADAEQFMQHYMELARPSTPTGSTRRTTRNEHPSLRMASPIRGVDEPDYVRAIKTLMCDVSLEVANWAANATSLRRVRDERHGRRPAAALDGDRALSFKRCGEQRSAAIGRWQVQSRSARAEFQLVWSTNAFAENASRLVSEDEGTQD